MSTQAGEVQFVPSFIQQFVNFLLGCKPKKNV